MGIDFARDRDLEFRAMRVRTVRSLLMPWVVLSSVAGCTSISWSDDAGRTHHLGLVACRIREETRGTTLTHWSLGSALRLSGFEAGYSLGWRESTLVQPDAVEISDPRRLAASVAAFHGAAPDTDAREVPARWGFLYFTENVSGDASLIRSNCIGGDLGTAEFHPGLWLGWSTATQVVGEAATDDHVLVARRTEGDGDQREFVLWKPGWTRKEGKGGDR